ncbi:MAG TPA: YjbE family putative metal transport protein [Ktedonobacterales bacterium]|jgi:YjbE family integral membrane protein|nr:YjbE family putative metal transport protein [Ktedonobacterales bacterium]
MDANWLTNVLVPWLLTLGGIILVDIALSGDNALVIGAAASRLPARQRTIALLWGGACAAALRIGLTGIATELLLIPLLQTVGAAVILFIAIRMLAPEKEDDSLARRASDRLMPAIISILIADVTMSIDNILAIGALAHGNIPLLIVGLAISIALLLLASAVVARLISRFWWLMDLAALVLGYLAAQLVIQDPSVSRFADLTGVRATALEVALVALVGAVALWQRFAQARRRRMSGEARSADAEAITGTAEGAATPSAASVGDPQAGDAPQSDRPAS